MHGKVEDREQNKPQQNKPNGKMKEVHTTLPQKKSREGGKPENSRAQHGFRQMNVESNSYSSPLKTQNTRGTKALAGQTANQG